MSTPLSQTSVATLTPGRGLRSFSTPGDPTVYPGLPGIHYAITFGVRECLFGVPIAVCGGLSGNGASYLSNIHGALGSDSVNPGSQPVTTGFNSGAPAFPQPEVTGYYVNGPNANNPKANGFYNTEKVQRNPSDNPAGNGTIQIPTQGRRGLNFSLWIAPAAPTDFVRLSLYRDLNAQDKIAGVFGAGAGVADINNALIVGQWSAPGAPINQNKPNLVTLEPFIIPAETSLYMIFENLAGNAGKAVVGGIWFS